MDPNQSAGAVVPPAPDGTQAVPVGAQAAVPPAPDDAIPPAPDGTKAVPASATTQQQAGPVSRFASGIGSLLNPVGIVKGLAGLVAHPSDTLSADADFRTQAQQDAKKRIQQGGLSNVLNGGAEAAMSMVPFLGSAGIHAGQQIESGNVAGGLGEATGLGISLAAPEAIKGIKPPVGGAAESLYRGALKPSASIRPAEVARGVAAGLDNKIVVNSSALDKLGTLVQGLEDKQGAVVGKSPDTPISTAKAVSNIADNRAEIQRQFLDPDAPAAVDKVAQNLQDRAPNGSMPASEAFALKKGMYREIGDARYGQQGTPKIEALKGARSGLKDALYEAFPELTGMNEKEGGLLALEPMMDKALRRNPPGVLGADYPSVLGAAEVVAGHGTMGTSLIGASVLKKFLNMPAVKSRLAISLSNLSKDGIGAAKARIATYANSLGNAQDSSAQERPGATHLDSQTGKQVYKDPQKGWVDVETGQPVQ